MAFMWPTAAFPGLFVSAVMQFLMNTQMRLWIALGQVVSGNLWPQNFHHTLGAIDGKHVAIRYPKPCRCQLQVHVGGCHCQRIRL